MNGTRVGVGVTLGECRGLLSTCSRSAAFPTTCKRHAEARELTVKKAGKRAERGSRGWRLPSMLPLLRTSPHTHSLPAGIALPLGLGVGGEEAEFLSQRETGGWTPASLFPPNRPGVSLTAANQGSWGQESAARGRRSRRTQARESPLKVHSTPQDKDLLMRRGEPHAPGFPEALQLSRII